MVLRRAWSLVVVVLEGKMHWAIGRIGWRGRRERWRSVVVVVVVVMVMYFYVVVRLVLIVVIVIVFTEVITF